jgi:tetratricopeptide (TPR) repeat protein
VSATTIPLARTLVQKGKLDLAVAEYETHLQANPSDARVWQFLGDLHLRRADATAALEAYRRSADQYIAQGFYAKACALYKQILALAPGSIEAHLRLSDLYTEFALVGDAQRELEAAAKLAQQRPEEPIAREVEERLRRTKAHTQQEDLSRVRQRAQTLLGRGRPAEAVAALRPCFDAEPDDVETLELLAQALMASRKSERALMVLKRLAFLAHDAGENERRDNFYARILVLSPHDSEALTALGIVRRAPAPAPMPQMEIIEEIIAE